MDDQTTVWVRVISEFIPIHEIMVNQLFFLQKRWRNKILKRALVFQPLSEKFRVQFWKTFCGQIGDLVSRFGDTDPTSLYLSFVTQGQNRPPESVAEVERDVVRTMPGHENFTTELGREKLFRVLLAVSAAQTGVGYCQGMNFVAATLLVNMAMNECDSFWVFMSILENFHFKHLFAPDVPLLPLRMFHFSRLVRAHLPQVWHHLNSHTFTGVEIFANQWIMTLFAYYLEPEILGRVWDLFFLLGWKYLFQLGLTILSLLEPHLCAMDVEEISAFMASSRGGSSSAIPHPFSDPKLLQTHLLASIERFRITTGQLEKLTEQFLNLKIMEVIEELGHGHIGSKHGKTIGSGHIVRNSKTTAGFKWVFMPNDPSSPAFLQIDLVALTTPNRPRQRLESTKPHVWMPIQSLKELKSSTDHFHAMHQKETGKLNLELAGVEQALVSEGHVVSSLHELVQKAEDALKEAAKQKYVAARAVKTCVGPVSTNLTKKAEHADIVFVRKKDAKDAVIIQLSDAEKRMTQLSERKTDLIQKITRSVEQLEEAQNDIVSRSIQSAIDSFSVE
jgi:hypothetical protein